MAWVKYDILTSWAGGFVKEGSKVKRIADAKEYRETHTKQKLNACA